MSEPGALSGDAGDSRRTEIPLRQAAYERIENLLKNGALRPGQIVSQRELVQRTGLTLGAVREAVPRLEAEGLLQTVPQRGLMVPSLDITFVRDAYQLRRVLELSAVPAVIERMPDEAIGELIQWHRDLRARIRNSQGAEADLLAEELQNRDWTMHEGFVAMTGNRLMINIFRVTAIKIRMAVQSRIQVTSYNAQRVIEEHLAFLEPLARRDAEAMTAGLTRHIDNSLTIALGGTV